jgi:CubicO group peptidase (beta-lactamase class C family)
VRQLGEIPLEFEPGTAWNYSVSTDVLGWIIGEVSGVPFADFLRERVLWPLGMLETDFQVSPQKADRMTTCYRLDSQGAIQLSDAGESSVYFKAPRLYSGGGGLTSTTADYLRFCGFVLERGEIDGVRLLSVDTFNQMARNQLPGDRSLTETARGLFSGPEMAAAGFGFGFGVSLRTTAASSRGDLFWGGMAGTYFWVDPVERLSVLFMTQMIPSTAYALRQELRQQVYAALRNRGA